jgi:4-amino-4-deoxy-L-arabinose transferase-like glycosyltransferase
MEWFSKKVGATIGILGFLLGVILLFNSPGLEYLFIGSTILSAVVMVFWRSIYWIEIKYYRGLIVLAAVTIFCLGFLILNSGNEVTCFSFSYQAAENPLNGQKKIFKVECSGEGQPPWYWRKTNISIEDCRKNEKCKVPENIPETGEGFTGR